MLFNSYIYIFLFLPLTIIIYFVIAQKNYFKLSISFLVLASLAFYGFWNPAYLPLILTSIAVNYYMGLALQNLKSSKKSLFLLLLALVFNLALLGYYKYSDFFIVNTNRFLGAHFHELNVILPLGISFFTFTQIAYLIDSYKKEVQEKSFINYILFVTFFPHLLAGPIIHHAEMIPQFASAKNKAVNWDNIFAGLILFSIGLFKKTVIADHFAFYAAGYYQAVQSHSLNFWESWTATLSYSIQIYFDFSGYTDMAIGTAALFNIKLPINFNSPYKAVSIQDFWRRWHITLSRFLRDYIYIPLGGNKKTQIRTDLNVILVFLVGGIWHGAGWVFMIWGALHGLGYIVHRFWKKLNLSMNKFLAIFITFMFINITWIFFRSGSIHTSISILHSIIGLNGIGTFSQTILWCILVLFASAILPNSQQILNFVINRSSLYAFLYALVGMAAVITIGPNSPFIYFQF